jgi:hypothetical protein
VTKQRKSTLKPKRKERGNGSGTRSLGVLYPVYLALFAMMVYSVKVSFDVCHEEFVGLRDIMSVKQCVLHTVLWAASDRPGIAFIPH